MPQLQGNKNMHVLRTRATVTEKGICCVEWHAGRNLNGLLTVKVSFAHPLHETGLYAELLAIQHLLFNMNIFRMQVVLPEPMILEVSDKRILGLASGYPEAPLASTSAFLRNRLKGATVRLNIEQEYFGQIDRECTATYEANEPSEQHFSHVIVDSPCLDRILINMHAIDKYVRLHKGGNLRKPISSLVSRLSHPGLVRMAIPDHVLRHKLFEYQNNENIEVWGIPEATLRFLVVNERSGRCLRTVFRRRGG